MLFLKKIKKHFTSIKLKYKKFYHLMLFLYTKGACYEAVKFVGDSKYDLRAAINNCTEPEWLLWYIHHANCKSDAAYVLMKVLEKSREYFDDYDYNDCQKCLIHGFVYSRYPKFVDIYGNEKLCDLMREHITVV